MLRLITILTFALVAITSAKSQERGSADAYRIIAGAQNAQINRVNNWKLDTKLSINKLPIDLPLPEDDSLSITNLKVGQVGSLAYYRFEVLGVEHENELLLRCGSIQSVWLKGVPTKGLVDKQHVRLVGLLEITGTHTYQAVLGQRTVPVVEFLQGDKLAKAKKKIADDRFVRDSRTWEDVSGEFSVTAIYRGYEKSMVSLEKRDGKVLKVKLSKLSTTDNKWMREQIRKERAEAEKEKESRRK